MQKKGIVFTVLLAVMLMLTVFAGCGDDSDQAKNSRVSVVTDNDVTLNLLEANMNSFGKAKKNENLFSSLKAKVSDDSIDFTSLSYSEDTVCVGDVVYVEGTIPQKNYPAEKVIAWSDPEGLVSFENAVLTNNGEDTVLTFEVVGEKTGTAEIAVQIEDSEYYHHFDIEVVDSSTRTMPSASGVTVYCTPTGGKYHSYGCSYLRGNGIEISLDEALAKGLGPCSRCNPY